MAIREPRRLAATRESSGHEDTKSRRSGQEPTKRTRHSYLHNFVSSWRHLVDFAPSWATIVSSGLIVVFWWLLAPQTIDAQAPARRIISLVPALTEILFAIGAGPQVIAVSSYDDDPPDVLKLPRVGALLDPDTERILAMRPDLVLIYASQTDLQKQLESAGIRVFVYRHGGLADVAPAFGSLGTLTGRTAEAQRVSGAIQKTLDGIRARVAGRPRPATLLVMGREPRSLRNLDASGGVGFLHDMIEVAGGTNVFADIKRQAVRASSEMLLTRSPEVIVDLFYSREMSDAELQLERAAWKPLQSIPAVRQNRIHLLVGDYLVVPGPRIAQAAEAFARAIHPESFLVPGSALHLAGSEFQIPEFRVLASSFPVPSS